MNTNHHLSKPAMIGKLNPAGTFDVVWRSINPIKASVWSRYIPESADLPPTGRSPGFAADAPSRHSRNGKRGHFNKLASVDFPLRSVRERAGSTGKYFERGLDSQREVLRSLAFGSLHLAADAEHDIAQPDRAGGPFGRGSDGT